MDANGNYNPLDGGAHRYKFEKIKRHYVVGCEANSRMLSAEEIRRKAPAFVDALGSILGIQGERAIDIISRKGRILTAMQLNSLLAWLNRVVR